MTGKPRASKPREGACTECGEKVPLVHQHRTNTWVVGYHNGNRRGIGAGCSGVAYPPKEKTP